MATPIPGDIVQHLEVRRVVVDVTDDGYAVLRDEDDIDLERPVVVGPDDPEFPIVGHLEGLEGWIEDLPGEWRRDS